MKLSLNVLLGVLATISAASAASFDLRHVPASLEDVPMERRAEVVMSQVNSMLKRRLNVEEDEAELEKRGSTVETTFNDGSVIVDAYIGQGKNKVPMLLDTGGYATFVKDSFYNPSNSSTSQGPFGTFSIGYMSGGGATGPMYKDKFKVGDETINFPFGVVGKKYENVNPDPNVGGIMAMRFPGSGEFNVQLNEPVDYLSSLHSQGKVGQKVYQISVGKGGKLLLGDTDDSLVDGQFYELDNSGYVLEECGFKGNVNGIGGHMQLDTGTSHIVTTPGLAMALYTMSGVDLKFDDNGDVHGEFDCDKPPSVKISADFSSFNVKIPKDVLSKSQVGKGKCMYPVVGSKLAERLFQRIGNGFLLGQSFLSEVSFSCNFDDPRKMKIGKQKKGDN